MNCTLVRGFNVGTFLHQQLCNFNMAIACCPKKWCPISILCMHKTCQIHYLQSNITKQTNIALLHTIQFPIGCTSHTLLVEGHVSCFIACAFQCGKLVQNHKCCAMCSPHQSHISGSATIPTYSTCTCPYSISMSILCASMQESYSPCQISTMDAPFCAHLHYKCISCNQNKFILIVVAFQFSSCTFIHQTPSHNCVTILGHSKYDILVRTCQDSVRHILARYNFGPPTPSFA